MQTNPRSLANIRVTPEQRKANAEKMSQTMRAKAARGYAELWEEAQRRGLTDLSNRKLAKELEISGDRVRRMRKWLKGE